jgi:serine/threonine protein phosphatase PrpC
MNPYTSFKVEPNEKNQDYANVITHCENIWMIIVDGHGRHHVPLLPNTPDLVTWLKKLDWVSIVDECTIATHLTIDPVRHIVKMIDQAFVSTAGIGASISIACISPMDVKMWWRGDSLIKLYEDGFLVASTRNFSVMDECEKERLKTQNISYTIQHSHQIKALNDTQMTMVNNPYCIFSLKTCSTIKEKIAITQVIGHDNVCGDCDNNLLYKLVKGKTYKLVGGSDGLWDVMSETNADRMWVSSPITDATQLVSKALERWQQPWVYIWKDDIRNAGVVMTDRDDICAATVHLLSS